MDAGIGTSPLEISRISPQLNSARTNLHQDLLLSSDSDDDNDADKSSAKKDAPESFSTVDNPVNDAEDKAEGGNFLQNRACYFSILTLKIISSSH